VSLIQILLGLCVFAGVVLYFTRLRSLLFDRLIVGGAAAGVLLLVMRPGLSTRMATVFGVGRGVDLLFYITHAGTLLVLILVYAELRAHAARTTELGRTLALLQARPPSDADSAPAE